MRTRGTRGSGRRRIAVGVTLAGAIVVLGASAAAGRSQPAGAGGQDERPVWTDAERRKILSHSALPPVPPDPTNRFADDEDAAMFGRRIFFDNGFSTARLMSCASCHLPSRGWADGRALPVGFHPSRRHAPSVLDSGHQRWLFWDGRADSLWAQALDPFEDFFELRSSRVRVIKRIATDRELRRAYERAIGALPSRRTLNSIPGDATPARPEGDPWREAWDAMDPAAQDEINRAYANVGKSLAAFQRKLVSGPSPFDRYVESLESGGDGDGHLSPSAERGLRLFIDRANCRTCHAASRFSDGAFHATGVPSVLPDGAPDAGRFAAMDRLRADEFGTGGAYSDDPTGSRARIVAATRASGSDYAAFRTPSLRNVARTGPYMHGGQFETLEDVVRFYSTLEGAVRYDHHGQSVLEPLGLDEQEIADLVAFLESLSGGDPPAPWGVDPRPDRR